MNILKPLQVLRLKPVHHLLRNPIRGISLAPSLRQSLNSDLKIEDDTQINIRKVAKYIRIAKKSNTDNLIDQCVKVAIKSNMKIPKVSVDVTKVSMFSVKRNSKLRMKFPGLTGNHVTPLETEIIKRNAERFRSKLKLDKDQFYEELFLNQDAESSEKENIVGHFLSQGLEEPRHPGEVFHQLKVETFYKKGAFTDEENVKIMEDVNDKGESSDTFKDLEKELRRYCFTIRSQYREILKHEDKTSAGKFSLEESQKILKAVYDKVPNFLEDEESVSAVVRDEELAAEMNRKPQYIAQHWNVVLHPLLTRHEAGVLEVDFRPRIVKHCADNGIRYRQEADWAAIASLPQFRGTTATWLAYTYGAVRSSYKQLEKERGNKVKDAEVTSEVLLDYLLTRNSKKKQSNVSKRENEIIECYESLK